MAERFSNNPTPDDEAALFEALSRPNRMTDEYQRVVTLETEINAITDPADQWAAAEYAIATLNEESTHYGRTLCVTGEVIRPEIAYSQDGDDAELRVSASTMQYEYAEDLLMSSRGYFFRPDEEDAHTFRIYHIACTGLEQVATVENTTQLFKQDIVLIRPSSEPHVTCLDDEDLPHVPELDYYMPGLVTQLEDAVESSRNTAEALQYASMIDLSPWAEQLHTPELRSNLANLIDCLANVRQDTALLLRGPADIITQHGDCLAMSEHATMPLYEPATTIVPAIEDSSPYLALNALVPHENQALGPVMVPITLDLQLETMAQVATSQDHRR